VWGIEFGADIVHLVVDAAGHVSKTELYGVESPRGLGDWVEIELRVDLPGGSVTALVDGETAGQLPFEIDGDFVTDSFRASYDGGGPGNTATILVDDVTVDVPITEPFYFASVRARAVGGSAAVTWDVVAREPLAGFRVYRMAEDQGEETLASGPVLLPADARRYDDAVVPAAGKVYQYVVAVVRTDGTEFRSARATLVAGSEDTVLPVRKAGIELSNGFPNPFTTSTAVEYTLPHAGPVTLSVYDVRGSLVATVESGVRPEGTHRATWNGLDRRGNRVSGGTYFFKLETPGTALTRKIVLIR
jgi:hypothetical protein